MPPRKRKATPASDAASGSPEEAASPVPAAKKVKAVKAKKEPVRVVPLDPLAAVNIKVEIPQGGFEKKVEGTVRIASFNVAGIRASVGKGLRDYIIAEDADILMLYETKVNVDSFDLALPNKDLYPHTYWGSDPKKGNAGTAILSKLKPISVVFGMPELEGQEGRMITLEFETYYLIATYVPNAGAKLVSMDRKKAWNIAFESYLHDLDAKKPVIWGGDINVVRNDKDIRNWKTNFEKSAGCTTIEINGYLSQVEPSVESGRQKFIDVWRHRNPDVIGAYTYFSYMREARNKGIGWRLDAFNVSERINDKIKSAVIRSTVYGASDHLPIVIEFEV